MVDDRTAGYCRFTRLPKDAGWIVKMGGVVVVVRVFQENIREVKEVMNESTITGFSYIYIYIHIYNNG